MILFGAVGLASRPATAEESAVPAAVQPAEVPQPSAGTPAAISPEKDQRLLADEIIRQLRRLGINFSKTRISNPYDPAGYVC